MSVGISLRSFFWFSNLSSLQFLIHSSYFSICLSHQQTISAGVAVLPNQEPYKSNNSSHYTSCFILILHNDKLIRVNKLTFKSTQRLAVPYGISP